MTQRTDSGEAVSLEELTFANTIQIDSLAQLLIEKGLISEQEFYSKLKEVQAQYDMQEVK